MPSPRMYEKAAAERDLLAEAVRELLLQVDDGPRGCYGTESSGNDVWKGSFLARIERLRTIVETLNN